MMKYLKSGGGLFVSCFFIFRKSALKNTKMFSAKCIKLLSGWEENQKKGIMVLVRRNDCTTNVLKVGWSLDSETKT